MANKKLMSYLLQQFNVIKSRKLTLVSYFVCQASVYENVAKIEFEF